MTVDTVDIGARTVTFGTVQPERYFVLRYLV